MAPAVVILMELKCLARQPGLVMPERLRMQSLLAKLDLLVALRDHQETNAGVCAMAVSVGFLLETEVWWLCR